MDIRHGQAVDTSTIESMLAQMEGWYVEIRNDITEGHWRCKAYTYRDGGRISTFTRARPEDAIEAALRWTLTMGLS